MLIHLKALALGALAPALAQAAFPANASSHLQFPIPHDLHMEDGYNHSAAHFGSHGTWSAFELAMASPGATSHLTHRLVSAEGTLCEPPNANITLNWPDPPFLLLVDGDGPCNAVAKVREAQKLGASGVLLAHDSCLCGEANCTETDLDSDFDFDSDTCEDNLPMFLNDGSAGDVTIPSMLILKSTEQHLKKQLKNKRVVVAEMVWQVPKQEQFVQLSLVHSPVNMDSQYFLTNFSILHQELVKPHVEKHHHAILDFYPRFHVLDGTKLGCHGNSKNPDDACFEQCVNDGRYCAIGHHGITGQQVVEESLRRLCLWKHVQTDVEKKHEQGHHGDIAESFSPFWKYLDHFTSWCQSSDYFANPDCYHDALKHSQVKVDDVESCMKDSGDIHSDDVNSLLAEAASLPQTIETPSIWIHGKEIEWDYGAFSTSSPKAMQLLLQGICNGFADGLAPDVCAKCAACGDPVACATRNPMKCFNHDGDQGEHQHKVPKGSGGGKKKGRFFVKLVWTVIVLGAAAGGFLYYKKYVEGDGGGGGSYTLTDALMSDTA